ncbi:MAG TPA: outer membrane protein assembly factor BamA [Thermoanaerobaculia bacterium]|jgi:outer membrane protein insertion porin family|nr:outer membrane protein assembly factor BamA [Thermoanaerobaculia bacterium]
MLLVVLMAGTPTWAQTTPTQERPRPRPGTILETPPSGRITDAPAAPQQSKPSATGNLAGQSIERFEVVGNASVASDTIRVYLGVSPGDPYSPELLQKNFENLWQTGLFDDIKIEAERGDTGVVIRTIVKERPRIASVEYRGNKELNAQKVQEALERDKIDLHVGNTIEQTLVKRAAESIKRAYSEGGFEGVAVDTLMEDFGEPGEKKIVFVINEGVKAKVASIDFVGNKRFSDRRLRGEMKEVKKHNLITWIRKKNLYIPSKLDEDLEHVKNYYQDHGYQDVSFGDPQIKTQKKRVRITIPVKEGDIHTFGDVTVTGNTVFTSEQIIGNWPLKKGDTLSRKPMQARLEAFDEAYRMRGYIYGYIDPEFVDKGNNVVDINLRVFEGEQFRLGRLEFEGNTTTKDKVLRREIFLEEGQIMDMETFKQSLYKLGQLGYFKVTENPDFKVNSESKTVDITVKGIEEGKNDIQFGGGYSEGGGFFMQAQFATRNFLGEGENFSLGYQRGQRTNYFSIAYSDPWFLDTPNSLGVSVYNRETVLPQAFGYEQRGKGGTVAYGYRLRRFDSLSLIYGYERAHSIYQTVEAPDPNGNIPVPSITDLHFTTSTIVPSYRFDSRDNPFDTMRGARMNVSLAYSGGPIGGTIDMFKPSVGFTKFHRLSRKSAVSFNVEGGYILPFGDDDDCAYSYDDLSKNVTTLCIPPAERFLVGGESSVRGFRYGTLGPYENYPNYGPRPAGGYKYHTYNFEYVYRVNDPLRMVLFADAGKAYGYREDFDFSKLRYSFGAEMRVFLPVFQFPLRFIYAVNPREEEGDDFEGFQFTIGNTF